MAFFRKCNVFFKFSKRINQKTIPDFKFRFPANFSTYTLIGEKFKYQVQDSFLEYFFSKIWRFEKQIALSESHLYTGPT